MFPSWKLTVKDENILLAFRNGIGSLLAEVVKYGDAVHLAKAVSILHREILGHKLISDDTFHNGCIEEAILPSLLAFVCIIEHGADIKSQLTCSTSKSDLALSQPLQCNCFAKYKEGAKVRRHPNSNSILEMSPISILC